MGVIDATMVSDMTLCGYIFSEKDNVLDVPFARPHYPAIIWFRASAALRTLALA